MEFKTRELDNKIIIIEAPLRLEGRTSLEFRKRIIELADSGYYKIIVDLKGTEFMDSNGVSSLVSRISVARSNNGDVVLLSPSEFIQNILKITHLNKIFKIFDSEEEAIKSLNQ